MAQSSLPTGAATWCPSLLPSGHVSHATGPFCPLLLVERLPGLSPSKRAQEAVPGTGVFLAALLLGSSTAQQTQPFPNLSLL